MNSRLLLGSGTTNSPDDSLRQRQQRPHRARAHARTAVPPEIKEAVEAVLAGREEGVVRSARPADVLAAGLQEIRKILDERR